MSGLKRALLLLRRSAHSVEQPILNPSLADGLELDHDAYLLGNLDASRQRQWLFDTAMQDRHSDLVNLEQEIGRGLIAIQTDALSGLTEQETGGLAVLQEQTQQLQALIDQQAARLAELQSGWQYQNDQIESQAQEAIQSARTISIFISETYPDAPLTEILAMISMAEEGLSNSAGQAALVWAQQALTQAATLRTRLEISAIEFSQWLGVALYHLDLLDSTLLSNKHIRAIDAEGRELDTWIDVDPWVNGRLSQLERAIGALRLRLQTPSEISLLEIKYLVEKHIPEMNHRLCRLLEEARQAVLAAQMRVNIADLIVSSLSHQGYAIQSAGFSQADMRCQYDLTLENPDGGIVQVHVIPLSSRSSRHELVLDSRNDAVQSEHELRRRANEILASLRQFGISAQDVSDESTPENRQETPSLQLPVILPCPLPVSL